MILINLVRISKTCYFLSCPIQCVLLAGWLIYLRNTVMVTESLEVLSILTASCRVAGASPFIISTSSPTRIPESSLGFTAPPGIFLRSLTTILFAISSSVTTKPIPLSPMATVTVTRLICPERSATSPVGWLDNSDEDDGGELRIFMRESAVQARARRSLLASSSALLEPIKGSSLKKDCRWWGWREIWMW